MNKRLYRLFWLSVALMLFGCGGSTKNATEENTPIASDTPQDIGQGPVLTQAELTSALDASGLKAAAPASTEFLPDTPTVYFLGTAERLPREADIEVRWTQSTMGRPLTVTHASGSDTYTFSSRFDLAKFVASEKKPYGEKIQALVFVNGTKIGQSLFTIADRRSGGLLRVKELEVSQAIETGTNVAVNPSRSFRKGTKKVFASFFVGGLEPGGTILVRWLHEDNQVRDDDIESQGEKRYVVTMESAKGLAIGDWSVEVEILGEVFAERSFFMGDESTRTEIEEAALGIAVGKNRMPKKSITSFKPNVGAVHCGIRFLYTSPNSKVEIQWISFADGSENILQTTTTEVKKEGPTTINMAWRPGKTLSSGPYKAVIMVNGAKMQELAFEIQ